jgi:nitrite reductase (NADH) small subunit
MTKYIQVAKTVDVFPGTGKKFEVGDRDIAIFNVDGKFCAIDDMCPHRGGPLSEGPLEKQVVTCPWHGWEFDVVNGLCPTNPAAKVNLFDVKVEGDFIFVAL